MVSVYIYVLFIYSNHQKRNNELNLNKTNLTFNIDFLLEKLNI